MTDTMVDARLKAGRLTTLSMKKYWLFKIPLSV